MNQQTSLLRYSFYLYKGESSTLNTLEMTSRCPSFLALFGDSVATHPNELIPAPASSYHIGMVECQASCVDFGREKKEKEQV